MYNDRVHAGPCCNLFVILYNGRWYRVMSHVFEPMIQYFFTSVMAPPHRMSSRDMRRAQQRACWK